MRVSFLRFAWQATNDLDYIIDKKVNLLSYIEFKVNQITMNSPSSKYENFYKKSYEQ